MKDVSEDILCISKDVVSLKTKFTTGLDKILHRGQYHQMIILVHFKLRNVQGEW